MTCFSEEAKFGRLYQHKSAFICAICGFSSSEKNRDTTALLPFPNTKRPDLAVWPFGVFYRLLGVSGGNVGRGHFFLAGASAEVQKRHCDCEKYECFKHAGFNSFHCWLLVRSAQGKAQDGPIAMFFAEIRKTNLSKGDYQPVVTRLTMREAAFSMASGMACRSS
jgi:hypothetical protein